MLEHHQFCDHCPGCRPSIMNAKTGQPLADDHATMILINRIWNHETTYFERKAFIEVTLHNSQTAEDRRLFSIVMEKMEAAMATLVNRVN